MFKIDTYIKDLTEALKTEFGERFLFLGLQGSHLRGEATEKSDIDVVVILDNLSVKDLETYKSIINRLHFSDKACGFICGRSDMANWNPLEMCNFIHGTKDFFGKLSDFVPEYSKEDVKNFIKQSVGNIYHELCHRYIHSDKKSNVETLPFTYKGVFFILQSIYYLKDGVFYPTKAVIAEHLENEDKKILETATELSENSDYDFEKAFSDLFEWCKRNLQD